MDRSTPGLLFVATSIDTGVLLRIRFLKTSTMRCSTGDAFSSSTMLIERIAGGEPAAADAFCDPQNIIALPTRREERVIHSGNLMREDIFTGVRNKAYSGVKE